METLDAALQTIRLIAIGAAVINGLLLGFLAVKFVTRRG